MKIYVITKTEFEYNDEYYSANDGNSGKPVTAYKTKESAEEAKRQMTKEWAESVDVLDYGDDFGEVFDNNSACDILGVPRDYFRTHSHWDEEVQAMVAEHKKELLTALKLEPFIVTEIEVAEQ